MLRIALFCLKIGIVVALAYWLAERPGDVSIEWLGYRVDTTVGVLLLAVVVVAGLVALAYRFWRFLYRSPRDLGRRVQSQRKRRGYRALTQGMVAVAAGEPDEAARLARKADTLLKEPPLTMLLSAQAAQLNGDDAAAKRYFTAMLDNQETRFLGLRGLVNQALRADDQAAALDYVRRAHALRPRTPWVLTSLFDLSQRHGDLDSAERALRDAAHIKALPAPQAARHRAVLLLQRAAAARTTGHAGGGTAGAIKHAHEARRLAPDLAAAGALEAELLIAAGRGRKAAKVLEEAWTQAPHPDLARLYLQAVPVSDGLGRLRRLGKLTAGSPEHPESHLVLARAALDAKLWGEARRHLAAAAGPGGLDGAPREAVCRLMATLEEAEHDDTAAARVWLDRAATAPAAPGWVCRACGAIAEAWSPRCGACQAFDGLRWQQPPRVSQEIAPAVVGRATAVAGALAPPATLAGESTVAPSDV